MGALEFCTEFCTIPDGRTPMPTAPLTEAREKLSEIIDDVVAHGTEWTITRHGRPVARLVPVPEARKRSVREAIEAMEAFREKHTLGGLTIREMIDEGRRF